MDSLLRPGDTDPEDPLRTLLCYDELGRPVWAQADPIAAFNAHPDRNRAHRNAVARADYHDQRDYRLAEMRRRSLRVSQDRLQVSTYSARLCQLIFGGDDLGLGRTFRRRTGLTNPSLRAYLQAYHKHAGLGSDCRVASVDGGLHWTNLYVCPNPGPRLKSPPPPADHGAFVETMRPRLQASEEGPPDRDKVKGQQKYLNDLKRFVVTRDASLVGKALEYYVGMPPEPLLAYLDQYLAKVKPKGAWRVASADASVKWHRLYISVAPHYHPLAGPPDSWLWKGPRALPQRTPKGRLPTWKARGPSPLHKDFVEDFTLLGFTLD